MVYEWDEDMVIRHLIMPSHLECCTKPVLDWIAENMKDIPINIMDQYYPDNLCDPCSPRYDPYYKELARPPSKEEILEAYRYAKGLGLNFEILSFEDKNVSGLRV
jgi:putative pyruvate formate lyase activating enzyme